MQQIVENGYFRVYDSQKRSKSTDFFKQVLNSGMLSTP